MSSLKQKKVVATFRGNKSFVYSLAANPVNRMILTGGFDGTVTAFHLSSREALMQFSGHSEPIVSIAVDAQEGSYYATGAQDGLVRVWSSSGPSLCMKTVVTTSGQSVPL